jgi:hypothetical protein
MILQFRYDTPFDVALEYIRQPQACEAEGKNCGYSSSQEKPEAE